MARCPRLQGGAECKRRGRRVNSGRDVKKSWSKIVLRRSRYLLDILEIEQGIANDLKNTFKGYSFLDPGAAKERRGHSKEYGLIVNRGKNRLGLEGSICSRRA